MYGLDGVKLCADVVGVILNDVLFAGDKLPDTPRIDTPDFMLPAVIFASILEVTALTVIVPLPEYPLLTVKLWLDVDGVTVLFWFVGVTVIEVIPFFPLVGVKVFPLALVIDTERVSPFNSVTVPFTPRIETPLLIFPAVILLSIADVTAFTVTCVIPFLPLEGVIVC